MFIKKNNKNLKNINMNLNKIFKLFKNKYQILILNFYNIINVLFSLKNIDIYVYIRKKFLSILIKLYIYKI